MSYSDSETETQQCGSDGEVAIFRPLCCRGVVVNDGIQHAEHHVLNLSTEEGSFYGRCHPNRRHVAAVIPRLTRSRLPGSTSFAALGTTLCCVGGDAPDLFLLDVAKSGETWRKGPFMLQHRVCPRAVAAGGKLFVLGGCSVTSRRDSWAEVYDPSTGRWTYLPPLPHHLTPPSGRDRKSFFGAAVTVGGQEEVLVVGGWGETFCTYQPSTQTWSCPRFAPGLMSYFTPDSVAIGSTLYCFSRPEGCFLAYDFDSQTMFGGGLRGRGADRYLDAWNSTLCDGLLVLPGPDDDDDDGSINLIFLWSEETLRFLPSSSWDPPTPATHTTLYCAGVRLSKVKDTGSQNIHHGYLDACVVSSWFFPIAHSFQLQDALFM